MGERLTFEMGDGIVTFLDDFMGHAILPNGELVLRSNAFPDIDYIDWYSAYAVLRDGTVVAACEANWYVAQYDGSKQIPNTGVY